MSKIEPEDQDAPEGGGFISTYLRLLTVARARALSDGDAEDRLQEACLRLLESEQTSEIRQRDHYFKRILHNVRISALRLAISRPQVEIDEALADPQPGPDRIAGAKADLRRVADALEALPPRCREAFELHRFEELSYAQIAQRMGVSTSMVEKHIAAAVLRLSHALDK